jgi:hypothetical protein
MEFIKMFDHDDTLKLLQNQLEQLLAQREILDRQISGIKQSIAGLALYKGETNFSGNDSRGEVDKLLGDPVGITQAIRDVLRFAPSMKMTAMTIRDQLVGRGFNFSHYSSNPLSAINSILKRLNGTEVKKSIGPDGKAYYCWNT